MKKTVILFKSVLYLILCWLSSFVITMFFQTFYEMLGIIMCFAFGLCSVGACICLYGDFTLKQGRKMSVYDERHTKEDNSRFGLVIGAIPTAINYIFVLVLYLSSFEIIKFDFYPYYKTLTLYFVPLTYLFAPNKVEVINDVTMSVSAHAWELSPLALIVITVLPLVFLVTCWLGFRIGYKHIDVKERIIYGRK